MKYIPQLVFIALALPSCQSFQREAQSLGKPLGVIVPGQDWEVEMDIGKERVLGSSQGGRVLFWRTGDNKYCPGIIGESSFLGGAPPIGSARLDELRAAAVYDAVTKANCDVLAYPVFSWEEMTSIFHVDYSVQVKGFPGWVRGVNPIRRKNQVGVNHLPGSSMERGANVSNQNSRVKIFIEPEATTTQSPTAPRGSNWSNWDSPAGMP